jgi:hypothetical protein
VTITIDLSPRCSGAGVIHLAIVADLSGSMVGAPLDKMKQRIHALLDSLFGDFGGLIEVGIVTFDTEARPVCDVTGDRTLLNACIDAMTATLGDFGDVSGGIEAAQAMLVGASPRPHRAWLPWLVGSNH